MRYHLSRHHAGEIHGFINAACMLVFGYLRIGTDRAISLGFAAYPRADQCFGSDALFHPLDQRGDPIYRAASDASTAVEHAGYHVELVEFPGFFRAHLLDHRFVVMGRELWDYRRVRPPV